MDQPITSLQAMLLDEICFALGLPKTEWARRILGWPLGRATRRLAEIGGTFDRLCAENGLTEAAQWALTLWCTDVQDRGTDHPPSDGPLLVISNHPGTYDALVIASRLGREDLAIVVSDIPFLDTLPHATSHFIYMSMDGPVRMTAARQSIRHLRSGGALLLYVSGRIDPDPALSAEASADLDRWFRSPELFLKCVPQAKVLPCVVSHAVAPGWAHSPHRWLRRDPLDQRRLVEFAQVIQQLLWPGSLYLSPRLSFGEAVCTEALAADAGDDGLLAALIRCERRLMAEHVAAFGGPGSL
jgi:hypothetical protein